MMLRKLSEKLDSNVHLKEILTGSAITFVLKITGMLIGYALIFFISRNYGADGVGLYSIAINTLIFLSMTAVVGLNVSILRYAGQFNQNSEMAKLKLLYKYACELSLPIAFIFSVLLYLFAQKVAVHIFNNIVYVKVLRLVAVILPLYVLQNINVEFIRGIKKIKISEYFRSVNRPLFTIGLLPLALILSDSNAVLPLYTLGIGVMLGAIFSFFFIQKYLNYNATNNTVEFTKKELLSTSFPMMLTTIASFVMGNASIFLLEIFSTTDIAGIFSLAYKIAMLINIILVVINTISAPKFSELFWKKRHKELQALLDQSSKLISVSSIIMALFILILNENLLSIFGQEFVQGKFALIFLVIGQMINSMTGSVSVFMNMTGQQKVLKNTFILALLLNIILQVIFIPIYGIEGAAVANMTGIIAANLIPAIYVHYRLGFRTYYNPFSKFGKIYHCNRK